MLVDHGADVFVESSKGNNSLSTAFANKHWRIVEYLLEHDADIHSSLAIACENENKNLIKYLVENRGVDINIKDKRKNKSPLIIACECQNEKLVEYLMKHGAILNEQDIKENLIILINACKENNEYIVKCIIENGGNKYINEKVKDSKDNTLVPLICACQNMIKYDRNKIKTGNIIKYLIEHGADVNLKVIKKNNEILTPLYSLFPTEYYSNYYYEEIYTKYINQEHFENILKLLIDHGANINESIDNSIKQTLLSYACYNGYFNIVKFLVENGADVNDSSAPLINACHGRILKNNREAIVKYLVEHGADINIKNNNSTWLKTQSPLICACISGNLDVFKCLVEHGANINDTIINPCYYSELIDELDFHFSLLGFACYRQSDSIVKYLMDLGLNLTKQEINIYKILIYAFEYQNDHIVKCFDEHHAPFNEEINQNKDKYFKDACEKGNEHIIKYLDRHCIHISLNISLNAEKYSYHLCTACQNGHENIVRYLVEQGVSINAFDDYRNPLGIA